MIRFSKSDFKDIPNFKGGEGIFRAAIVSDERNKILKGILPPAASIGLHTHDTSSEIIFILSGSGETVCDGLVERVSAGDCLYCKKGSAHTLMNDGKEDLIFYAVVPEQ